MEKITKEPALKYHYFSAGEFFGSSKKNNKKL